MEHSPIQTVFWAIPQVSINLKGFKSGRLYSLPYRVKLKSMTYEKISNIWKLKNTLLKNGLVKEEITREIQSRFD